MVGSVALACPVRKLVARKLTSGLSGEKPCNGSEGCAKCCQCYLYTKVVCHNKNLKWWRTKSWPVRWESLLLLACPVRNLAMAPKGALSVANVICTQKSFAAIKMWRDISNFSRRRLLEEQTVIAAALGSVEKVYAMWRLPQGFQKFLEILALHNVPIPVTKYNW